MRARLVAIAALAIGAGACALVEGLGDLQKVNDVATANDAGGAGDAAGDGGFCAARSTARFCDDFDTRPLPGAWSAFHQSGGTLAIDQGPSASPPRSLLEALPAADAGPIDVGLRTSLVMPALPATLRFELAFRPERVDPASNAAVLFASLDFDDAAQNRYSVILTLFPVNDVLTLSLGEQTGLVDGGGGYTPHTVPAPIALGAWTRIAVAVTYAGASAATAQVSLDGVAAFSPAVDLHPTVPGVVTVLAGIGSTYETTPSAGWTLRYDDVVLDTP